MCRPLYVPLPLLLLLLLLFGGLRELPTAEALPNDPYVISTGQAIMNGTVMTVTAVTASVTHCAALCKRRPDCGGFNRLISSGRCEILLETSLRYSVRRAQADTQSGTLPARTCHQKLRQDREAPSGVQTLFRFPVPAYCDQLLDGGGWTLMVTAVTAGWTTTQVQVRNEEHPSISQDYSMFRRANWLRNHAGSGDFEYRLEAQAQTGRQQWGGIFRTPPLASLTLTAPAAVWSIVKKFGDWSMGVGSIGQQVPYVDATNPDGMLLRTSGSADKFGTIVSLIGASYEGQFNHSPWINPGMPDSGTVLYWIREN